MLEDNTILTSDFDNVNGTQATADTTADTNVPEVQGTENAADTAMAAMMKKRMAINEEAGLTEGQTS